MPRHSFNVGGFCSIAAFLLLVFSARPALAQPFCLELLGPNPNVAGEVNEFQLIGFNGAEDANVFIVYGLAPGDTIVPQCHLSLPIRNPRIAGRAQLNGGAGEFRVFVPRRARGVEVLFQAIFLEGCCVSNLGRTVFE